MPRKEGSSYAPTLKTKINLSSVRCWTPAGERIEVSEVNWKRSLLCPCVSVRQLWFVSRLMGRTLGVTDVVVHPSEEETLPFHVTRISFVNQRLDLRSGAGPVAVHSR